MTIAKKVQTYLDNEGVRYEAVRHSRTNSSSRTAQAAHVPGDNLAKSVVVHHELGYVLAVVPATHRIDLTDLQGLIKFRLGLASEEETAGLFDDCSLGAIPPVGSAYGVPILMDEALADRDEVWFEGGDHRTLIHVTGPDFNRLMKMARRHTFSHHV